MGRKKKKAQKPWCYYCDREFDDEKVLIQHQKAKHFKCHVCHKKLSTAGGMVVHVLQVHKENMNKVPNARAGRESVDIEIFGMEGIPPEAIAEHNGGEDEERPAKVAKVEVPPAPMFGAPLGMAPQPYAGSPPVFSPTQPPTMPRPVVLPSWPPPATPASAPSWPPPPQAPAGPSVRPPVLPPPRPPPAQPLFPIHGSGQPGLVPVPPSGPAPRPLFPIATGASSSAPQASGPVPPQPLFPIRPPQAPPGQALFTVKEAGSAPAALTPVPPPPVPLPPSNTYASGPTGGASIGPPPSIANKAPAPPPPPNPAPPSASEVYLVWDDENMTMEERRLSLPRYHVASEPLQGSYGMQSPPGVFVDRRIGDSRGLSHYGYT